MKQICDWNNCNKIGAYKAPVEKDNSKKFEEKLKLITLAYTQLKNTYRGKIDT